MTVMNEIYLKCKIEIKDDMYLSINNKKIDYDYDYKSKKWSSKYLPYSQYNSLHDLSKAITKDTSEFTTATK